MITSADVDTFLDNEHQEILENTSWSRRKSDSFINTVAPYATGTVSATGTTVTGSSTVWTSSMVGRFIRMGSATYFHKITAVASATSLTVENTLPADVAASSTYTIFQHVYSLPSNFGRLTSFTGDVRLTEWARADIDSLDPYRSATATRPDVYSIRGPDSSGVYEIEMWPVPSAANAFRFEYLKTNTLTSDSDSPLYRSDVLVWKASEAAASFLFARTGDQSWLALAERYHARYLESLQGAKEDDLGRFSPVMHIRDAALSGDRDDDYLLSHDTSFVGR